MGRVAAVREEERCVEDWLAVLLALVDGRVASPAAPTTTTPTRPSRRPGVVTEDQPDLRRLGHRPGDRRPTRRGRRLQRRRPTRRRSRSSPTRRHDELDAALDGGQVPDVFLVTRGDLADLAEQKLNSPIGDLLDERGVDFGDGYSRHALEAFASDRRPAVHALRHLADGHLLQHRARRLRPACGARARRAEPSTTSSSTSGWTFEQFQAAAEFASRPRRADRRASTSRRRCAGSRRSSTPAAARSSTTTRTRPRWRSPPTTPVGAGAGAAAAARPARSTLTAEQLAEKTPAGVVQGGQARDDRRLPRPGARSCARRRRSTSTSCRCRSSTTRRRSATSPGSASPTTPTTSPSPPTSWST